MKKSELRQLIRQVIKEQLDVPNVPNTGINPSAQTVFGPNRNVKQLNYVKRSKPKKDLKPPPTNPKRRTRQWFGKCKTYIVNKAKFKYATEYCQLNDIEFKILTEDHLQPRYK